MVKILPLSVYRPGSRFPILVRAGGGILALAAGMLLGCVSVPPTALSTQTAPVAVPAPRPETAALREGVAVERDLSPGGQDEIPLELERGLFLRFSIHSGDLDLAVSLIGPDGQTVARRRAPIVCI